MPQKADLWVSDTPAPHGYYGSYSQGETITISGGGNVGNSENQWYAVGGGGYFRSCLYGSIVCTRPEGSDCGSCSGGFGILMYATQGAVEGTVTVEPMPEGGLAGIPVWLSRDPSGGSYPTYTDDEGHFEFRAEEGLARSNNWGVGVDEAGCGPGQATYYVGSGPFAIKAVTVTSSELATVDLELPPRRAGGGDWPEKRGCGGGGGGGGSGRGGGYNEGGGRGSGSGSGGGSGGSEPPDSCDPGKPVNVQTGNVYFDQTDASVGGVMGLGFVRHYNSIDAYHDSPTSMSRGWSHSYSRRLSFPDARSIDFHSDDAVPIYYQDLDGDSIFDAAVPATERTRILKDDQEYRRVFPGGAYEVYDSSGRLTSIVDVAGNAMVTEYDGSGRLSRVVDAGGRQLHLSYDDRGRLVRVSVGSEVVAAYGYDDANLLRTVSYPDASGYVFVSDGRGQILRVEDKSGRAIESHTYGSYSLAGFGLTSEIADGVEKLTFSYEPWRTIVTDALGNTTTYHWRWVAGMRRVTKVEGLCSSCGTGGGDSKEWTHDEEGRIVSYRRNDETPKSYTWDAEGRMISATDPIGRTTTYTYDSEDRVLTAATPGGGLVTFTYGQHGPLTITEKVTETVSRTTSYTYTALGQIATVTDPLGHPTTYTYDASGNLTSVTDPLDHTTTFAHDARGRRTAVTDELDRTTTTTYDGRGRVLRLTRPDGKHTDYTYDLGGRRTSTSDPLGRTTRSIYDIYGRLVEVVDPIGGVTSYGYDVLGRLITLTDPKGQTTFRQHDEHGRLVKITYPGGAFEEFTYDPHGHTETKTDRRGVVTTYTYDGLGRLTGKTFSEGTPAVSYTYDAAGRLEAASNGSDTLSWTYDLAGQVVSETSTANASTVVSTYDLGGNRLSVSLDGQLFASYGYDDAGRLTGITRGSSAIGFGYDEVNRRTTMAYPNGITTSYGYDDLDRLLSLNAVDGVSTAITSFGYTYDAAGNRTRKQLLDYTEDYAYDGLSRLTAVERTGPLTGHWHHEYDAVGNRTVNQHDTTVMTATYDEQNRLLSTMGGGRLRVRGELDEPGSVLVNGRPARMLAGDTFEAAIDSVPGTNTFTVEATDLSGNVSTASYQVDVTGVEARYIYDANGNLVQKTEGGQTWTYEWNAENQLVRWLLDGFEMQSFAYDPVGRRIEISHSAVGNSLPTSMVYDGQDILRKTSGNTYSGPVPVFFIHGPGIDEPLAEEDQLGAPTFFHADGLGSVVAQSSASGALVSTIRYDAWGNIEDGAVTTHAFTGREWDGVSGLYYYRARYYDPKVGRFISVDPIGFRGGINHYVYVGNNPSGSIDPSGLQAEDCSCSISVSCLPTHDLPFTHCTVTVREGSTYTAYDGMPTGNVFGSRLKVVSGPGNPPGPNTFFTESLPCDEVDCVQEAADEINYSSIPYSFPVINSNSAAQYMVNNCGFFPHFPLSAWGARQPL